MSYLTLIIFFNKFTYIVFYISIQNKQTKKEKNFPVFSLPLVIWHHGPNQRSPQANFSPPSLGISALDVKICNSYFQPLYILYDLIAIYFI